VAFASVSSVSLIYIFAFKNLDRSILQTENFFQNKYLFAGVIYGFILILTAIYIPQINHLLGTVPLSIGYWFLVLAIGVLATVIIEIFKIFDHKI
jgi:magnesium-transporting ATPase (P-type)